MGDPLFCKLLGDPGIVPFLGPWDTDWLGLCRGFSHDDTEAGSLLPQADSVCHLAFHENEAFRESGLHSSECYLTC